MLYVRSMYVSFNGEQNRFGIGSPCIFLRFSGCNIHCYKKTLEVSCDTPEAHALKMGREYYVEDVVKGLKDISAENSGLSLVTITGGEPLFQDELSLYQLFTALSACNFKINIETNGSKDITKFVDFDNIAWVMDYKLPSTGHEKDMAYFFKRNLGVLTKRDIIKFVVYDDTDYTRMRYLLQKEEVIFRTSARIVAGVYWGKDPFWLFNRLKEDKLLTRVAINLQAHKYMFPNFETVKPKDI